MIKYSKLFNLKTEVHSKIWHNGAFLNIECKKYKNLGTKHVTTSSGIPYPFIFIRKCINIFNKNRNEKFLH